jgi:acetolactate synthase-1/3 small subunit
MPNGASTHTLSVLVQNKPGVLARIAGLISRRGYNIESLAVGPTESPDMSRITLQVNVEDVVLEQITKQLNKLIEVLKIVELEDSAVRRELVLVKVRATAETRSQLIEIIGLFGAKAVDLTAEIITVEAYWQSAQTGGACLICSSLTGSGSLSSPASSLSVAAIDHSLIATSAASDLRPYAPD